MKMIVGLGNPGKKYQYTKHNVGFIVIDEYIKNQKLSEKFESLYTLTEVSGEKVLIVKPLTFMNLSGNSIVKWVNFYKINPEDILVIHDDLDLDNMSYRLKFNSSSGGHNGIKSIIECLNTQNFARLKIGIGKDSNDVKDYVLSNLSKEALNFLKDTTFTQIINSFIKYGIEKTMNDYNKG